MALTKYCLGDLLELTTETNSNNEYGSSDVRGMTITKEIIPTKADVSNTDLSKFLVVHLGEFVFNPRTHGKKIGFGYNDTDGSFIISWNNIAFRIKKDMRDIVLSEYLFFHFNRTEWDREACFRSWGSSTEVFTWNALCEMELELPPLPVQQKYVAIYKAMIANQQSYERGLEDLKLVCDAYIEDLRRKIPCEKIGPYITRRDERNSDNSIKNVMGISVTKTFRKPTSKVKKDELASYKIVRPDDIAFVQTTHNEKVFAFACNFTNNNIVVSSVNEVFFTDTKYLLPDYLSLYFMRKEFDRYARFHSWGSARETFTWKDILDVEIPIPDIEIQRSVADIYKVYMERRQINEQLKAQIKNICPVLVRGAVEEGKNE